MKLLVVVILLFPFFSFAQNSTNRSKEFLPKQISDYYTKLNLANSFSTKSERSILTKYLDTQDVRLKPESKRLEFVMSLLNDIRSRHLQELGTMPNSLKASHIISSYLCEIQFYNKSENMISVRLKVYQLSASNNFKIINMFDEIEDLLHRSEELAKLSEPTYIADETHDWVLSQNHWLKKPVRKVLTNQQNLTIY